MTGGMSVKEGSNMHENSSSKIKGAPTTSSTIDKTGLPHNYGDTKLIIMPRDPAWFYAYWEVSPAALAELRRTMGDSTFNSSRWALRIYDITDVQFNGANAHRHFDVYINYANENWYINVGEFNRSWCADLGMATPDGNFVVVTRSNMLRMPRQGVSPVTDEQWAILQQEFERLLKLSGVEQIGQGSFDIAKLMRERWEEIVSLSLPSSFSVGGASSWRKAPGGEEAAAKAKTFWLKADTELIVYGATEPDAHLTVQGQTVSLRPDGSFSLRFYLPDGDQEYPIEATSADGTMKKKITFAVRRETK